MTTTESTFDQDFSALLKAVALCKCGYDKNNQWQNTILNPEWTSTTEKVNEYFRDVVPPAWMVTSAFACGEPHHHDEHDLPVYLCFRWDRRARHYLAKYCTVKELKEAFWNS